MTIVTPAAVGQDLPVRGTTGPFRPAEAPAQVDSCRGVRFRRKPRDLTYPIWRIVQIGGCRLDEKDDAPHRERDDALFMNDLVEVHLEWMREVNRFSPVSIDLRRRVLYRANALLPRGIDDVWPDEINAFLASPHLARCTSSSYHSQLSGFYRWAYREGYMTDDPMVHVRAPNRGAFRPKPVPVAELHHALASSPDPWLTCIMLGVCAGLRCGEMVKIRREDITQEFVHIREGKGGKERFVETSGVLWQFVSHRPRGLLVRRPDGRLFTPNRLSAMQRQHWRGIGLPLWHLHRLRHTFCTTMHRAGHSDFVLRDLMGHASVATTEQYTDSSAELRRAAVAAIDDLFASVHQPGCDRLVPPTAA